jgi:hypothetical protein
VIGAGPIFREVGGKLDHGDLDIDDLTSNQHNSDPATATPQLCWLSTKNNLINLADKAFYVSELRTQSREW